HTTGHEHPHLRLFFGNYQILLEEMKLTAADTKTRLDSLGSEAGYTAADWQVLQDSLKGVVIIQSLPNSQAERLGLKAGDVISHYSGKTITSAAQLIELIARTQGHDIPLEIIRDGKRLTFTVAEGKLGVKL
ncbi:MAG: PDZ domain-containing protein, partial [Methylococcaceae bacterium]